MTAQADSCIAAAFSITMRRYSAGEQVSRAIIMLRRTMVSHDAIVNSANVNASGRFRRELRFAMGEPS